jgi:hypothetical protein
MVVIESLMLEFSMSDCVVGLLFLVTLVVLSG